MVFRKFREEFPEHAGITHCCQGLKLVLRQCSQFIQQVNNLGIFGITRAFLRDNTKQLICRMVLRNYLRPLLRDCGLQAATGAGFGRASRHEEDLFVMNFVGKGFH